MRLILADDHVLVRDALKAYIERAIPGAEVLTGSSLDEALALIDGSTDPQLCVLDYRMPGMDGLEGLARMRARYPDLPVAIMSGLAGHDEIHEAIARGAAGFLPKTLTVKALVGAIQLMLSGERFLPVSLLESDHTAADRADGTPALTRRERDVLAELCKGRSNKEIARTLNLQEVTIKLHVRSLCRKLVAKNRTQAVLKAMDMGLAA